MHTALRTIALSAVAALAVGFGMSSTAEAAPSAAVPTAKAATRYYSLMSYADGRAVSVHQFYPTFTTTVAEAYDGSTRMQWGLVPRAGASDTLLVNRLTGACLTATGGYAVVATCGSAATQGLVVRLPRGTGPHRGPVRPAQLGHPDRPDRWS